MSSTTPYQILKVDTLYDTVTYDPVIALTLINAFRRIVVIIDNFPDFIYVEIPEYGTKWTTKKIDALFVELDIDMEFGFKYRRKYYNYSEEKYPIITLYSTRSSAFDEVIKVLKQYFVKKYMSINPHIAKSVANRKVEIKKYMTNFSMSQKFYAVAKINPGNWILLDESKLQECTEDSDEEDASRERQTEWSHLPTYRLENYRVLKRLEGYPPPEYLPNFRILCLDFEVNSSRTRRFPDPWEPADEIYLVSVVVGESRTMKKYGKIIVDKDLPIPYVQNDNDSEKSKVITVRDEIRLLKRLEKMIRDYDPDFITTYNGSSFDFPYWKARYDSVGEKLGCFGRFIHHPCTFKANNWSSSAHKSRDQELLVVPGICVFDLYVVTRRDKFYDIYTLDFVSAQVLGEKAKKDEVSAEDQFRIYREGTLEEWKKLLHYSLRDSWAPLQIIEKWNTTTMLLANASIIGINIDDIYSRGQQYRLENMVLQRLLPQGIVIDPPKNVKGEKYKGAIVQEPVLGLQEFLATLDFNSLYPSIMIHFNVSHDTFVGTNIEDLPPGLTWDDVNKIHVTEEKYNVFVKKHVREGSFPALLRVLLESRAQKKKQMKIEANKDEPDQVIIDNLDAEQLCLKVIANSGYGLLGAREGGKLPLPEGAESVTAMGRKLITDVVEELKRRYNAQIIYGDTDSVFFRLPEWKAIRSEEEAKERIESTKIISEEITNWIGRPPIKIALDHAYLNYICVKKKCYFSNEIVEVEKPVIIDGVERKETRLVLRFSYKGVPVARREHTKWLKIIYKRCALIALGRCTWEDQQVDIKVRKWNFELSLWDGIMELMQRQVPWEHLYKISQISRPAKEYKAKNYPMRLFLEREEREGRPMGVGERFKWLRVRQEPVAKGEKLYAGNAMRRAIEENEYLDEQFYLDSLKMPMRRISENVFNDKTMYTRMLADIKLKRQYLKELVERPWASWDRKVQNAKCSYKQVPKAERRKNRKTVE